MEPSSLSCYLKLADAVIITDIDHRIIDVNESYEKVTGYKRHAIVGSRAGILKSGLTPKCTYEEMKQALSHGRPWMGVFINRKRNKELWHSNITITPIVDKDQLYYVGIFRNLDQISEGVYVSEARKSKIQQEILKVLALSCEIRDPDIEEHLVRVQTLTERLLHAYNEMHELNLSESYIQQIVNASIMHDIGKSGIPEGILYKPGKLTFYERGIIETHPLIGFDILNRISGELDDELFRNDIMIAKAIVESHHEKWDGTGYPHQLKEDEIPFEAQVVSIVDVYDALTSRRAYKEAWTKEKALDFLVEQSGAAFNPALVDVFVQMLRDGE